MVQSGETDLQGLGNAVWDLLLAVDEPVLEVCWCDAVSQVVSSAEHQGSLASVQRCATRLTLLPEVQLVSLPRAGLWSASTPVSGVSMVIDDYLVHSHRLCPDV